MDKSDEYRRNAEYCQHMADWTHNEAEKRSGLSLAQSWLNKIRKTPTFKAQQAAPGADTEESPCHFSNRYRRVGCSGRKIRETQ
jgi:hypothetical protein